MRVNFTGRLVDEPEINAAVIGCGSHAFRNIFPTFQFAPVNLVATCDVEPDKAQAFARKFGGQRAYADHREMLAAEDVDAVFIVVGYDERGRPAYPQLAIDCMEAGCHVWIGRIPPAASCADVERMQAVSKATGRAVMVGFKKMFFPANQHAKRLISAEDFGHVSLARLEYPQYIPTVSEFDRYAEAAVPKVTGFLDHLSHPASLLLDLVGMPKSLYYERARNGAGTAIFAYESGAVATIAFTWGAAFLDGLERTMIVSDRGRHVIVENNLRVAYHRLPFSGYGDVVDFYSADVDHATAVWQPEFSLGQLYNKGLFALGYFAEVDEFARSVLESRAPAKAGLDHAWQVTHLFEAFARGPGRGRAAGIERQRGRSQWEQLT